MKPTDNRARLSRSERNGTLVLLVMLLALTFLKRPLSLWLAAEPHAGKATGYAAQLKQIEAARQQYQRKAGQAGYKQGYSSPYSGTAYIQVEPLSIEINSAAAADLEKLYGIGPVLAGRIVKFREGLGGFQRVSQLLDVYGIKPEVYEKIRANLRIKPAPVRRININEADLETLLAHPYIPPTLARQFVGYREKVKPFDTVDDVKNLYYLRDHPEHVEKLLPYLTVN